MFFRTPAECLEVARGFGFSDSDLERAQSHEAHAPDTVVLDIEHSMKASFAVARLLADVLGKNPGWMLWVTEYGIWPSHENRHLYYRVRNSYGDLRSLREAPGHFFEDYETADLITFLDLVIRSGWGALLIAPAPLICFISHDGWATITGLPNHAEAARRLAASDLLAVESPSPPVDHGPH